MADVALLVNGQSFEGWQRIRVVRGVESLCGMFELSISDRWNGATDAWPINAEDQATVLLDGTPLITGFVDRRRVSYDAGEHSLEVAGRDLAAALVDCSAQLTPSGFKNLQIDALIRNLAAPFGINVIVDPSLQLVTVSAKVSKRGGRVTNAGTGGKRGGTGLPNPPKKFAISPGESAFEVLDRACRMAGILAVSDGRGNIVLTQSGSTSAVTSLIEGQNILRASADFDASGRYASYTVLGQAQGDDEVFGTAAAQVKGTAQDQEVRRGNRNLTIRSEHAATVQAATTRAGWEAKIRAARGDAISVTVQGWTQADGTPWPVNALVYVESDLLGIKGDLLIAQCVHTLDESGTTTEMTLRRPDAFIPEPVIAAGSSGAWKELRFGV
jgi:prophage tail gpP-like protein